MKINQRMMGNSVLVDRLWPRGLSKEELDIDLWLKDIAPSTELRKNGLIMTPLNGMDFEQVYK